MSDGLLLFSENNTNKACHNCGNKEIEHVDNDPDIKRCGIQSTAVSNVINNGIDKKDEEQKNTQSIAHGYTADSFHTITHLRQNDTCLK